MAVQLKTSDRGWDRDQEAMTEEEHSGVDRLAAHKHVIAPSPKPRNAIARLENEMKP